MRNQERSSRLARNSPAIARPAATGTYLTASHGRAITATKKTIRPRRSNGPRIAANPASSARAATTSG